MTTKTLTGTYSAGYALSASYTALSITATGRVDGSAGAEGGAGGTGVLIGFAAPVTNDGAITGGTGGYGRGGFYDVGGTGGVGLVLAAGGSASNTGAIVGGVGGDSGHYGAGGTGGAGVALAASGSVANDGGISGGAGASGYYYGAGGAGGAGVVLQAGGIVGNTNAISGGAGGAGGSSYMGGGDGGIGGAGGAGVDLASASTLSNSGVIKGGAGGVGGFRVAGGVGGVGVLLRASGSVSNTGTIEGGAGGRLGNHSHIDPGISSGGAGVHFCAGGSLTNTEGAITGGSGGSGGFGGYHQGGSGGTGGVGALLEGGASLDNIAGSIAGGAGGMGGPGAVPGMGGLGGSGVILTSSGSVSNTGAIAGGVGGRGGDAYRGGGMGGTGGAGISLETSGLVANTGVIAGGQGGAGGMNHSGSSGPSGKQGDGVVLTGGGEVINGSAAIHTALISGAVGVFAGGTSAATVTNFGSILGASGVSVQFQSSGDRLIAEAGSVLTGVAQGGGGTLELAGGAGTISGLGAAGTLSGAIAMTFGGFSSYAIDAGASWTLAGANALAAAQSLTVSGALTIGVTSTDKASLTSHGALTVAGTVTGTGTLGFAGGSQALNAGAILTVARWSLSKGAETSVNEILSYAGVFSQSAGTTVTIAAGDKVRLTGSARLAGAVAGTGTLTFAGGTQALNGANLTVANWVISNNAVTSVNQTLSYSGSFIQAAATTLTVAAGDTLSLIGAATLAGMVNGAGTIKLSSATVGGLTVSGTVMLSDVGIVDQIGDITIGGAGPNAATLSIGAGATYRIDNDSGMARGKSAASSINNSGLLIKSGGTGISVIGLNTTDDGVIEAATGTLDLAAALSGAGSMKIDAGATLEADQAVASTLTARFWEGDGLLALAHPASFAATIHGFASTDTVDLLKTVATTATLGAGDTLVIKNGANTVATLQLGGDYTAATFTVASDGKGGTNITVTNGPVIRVPSGGAPPPDQTAAFSSGQRLIHAMAGFGGDSHGAVSGFSEAHYAHPPMLSAPSMAMA